MRRRSSFGFFGTFGRSADLRRLDAAMKAVDLHPALVPEGVKMAIVNLMKDHELDEDAGSYQPVADLFACCVLGTSAFQAVNGTARLDAVEGRIGDALETGEGLDGDLILLAIHSKLIRPEIVEGFAISVDEADESG